MPARLGSVLFAEPKETVSSQGLTFDTKTDVDIDRDHTDEATVMTLPS